MSPAASHTWVMQVGCSQTSVFISEWDPFPAYLSCLRESLGNPRGCDVQGGAVSRGRRALSHWQEGYEVTLQLGSLTGFHQLSLVSSFPSHPSSMQVIPLRRHLLGGGV